MIESETAILYAVTFLATFATDALYVLFVRSVQSSRPFHAASLSAVLQLAIGVSVIGYTSNQFALLPALAGAYIGTFAAMRFANLKSEISN